MIHTIINWFMSNLPDSVTAKDLVDYIIVLSIGIIGGLVRELHDYYDRGLPTSILEILSRMLTGAFVAFSAAEISALMFKSSEWTWIAAACSSYSGTEIMDSVLNIFKAKLDKASKDEAKLGEAVNPDSKPPLIENTNGPINS